MIFGTYLEPIHKVKSKHDAALQKLESLLTSGRSALTCLLALKSILPVDADYLLAIALARGANKKNAEDLARAYVYLFASHKQCNGLMEAFIASAIDGKIPFSHHGSISYPSAI